MIRFNRHNLPDRIVNLLPKMYKPKENRFGVTQLIDEPKIRTLQLEKWDEMVTDIIETPDFCDPGDSPQQVLEYARDVVSDYIRKRFPFDGE